MNVKRNKLVSVYGWLANTPLANNGLDTIVNKQGVTNLRVRDGILLLGPLFASGGIY